MLANKTKMEKRMLILLAIVAIFNILGLSGNYFIYNNTKIPEIIIFVILGIINEIFVVAVLILMIRKE